MPNEIDATKRGRYRAEIDGLRAISVLAVLGFHLFPARVPGGYLGVDVFFVISGFLITRQIFEAISADSFSLLEFYSRRARRILPPLLTVLMICWLFGAKYLPYDEFAELGTQMFASCLFYLNVLLQDGGGYFDPPSESKPLLHLWTLSVEEQFYLIWPVILSFLAKDRKRLLASVFLLLTASLLKFSVFGGQNPDARFYDSLGRVWEFLFGGVVALIGNKFTTPASGRRHFLGRDTTGLCLILLSFVFADSSLKSQVGYTILAAIGASLFLAYGEGESLGSRILRSPLFTYIGERSYSIYLWHWPLLFYARTISGDGLDIRTKGLVLLVSIVLSDLSLRLLEKPFRANQNQRRKCVFLLLIALALAVVGKVTEKQHGFPVHLDPQMSFLESPPTVLDWLPSIRPDVCHIQKRTYAIHDPSCFENTLPRLVLWGDSHAAALYSGLRVLQRERTFGLTQLTESGCPPLFGVNSIFQADCPAINESVFRRIVEMQPEILLIHASWVHEHYPLEEEELRKRFLQLLSRFRAEFLHTKVIILGPIPRWDPALPKMLNSYVHQNHVLPPVYAEDPNEEEAKKVQQFDRLMRNISDAEGVSYISTWSIFCDGIRCRTRFGDQSHMLMTVDEGHLTPFASEYLIRQIESEIFEKMNQ